MLNQTCEYGNHSVDPNSPETYQLIRGWVNGASKTDGVMLRTYTSYACKTCVNALVAMTESETSKFKILPVEPDVNKGHIDYKVGWLHGFRGIVPVRVLETREFRAGYLAGEQIREWLDGYFFFGEGK